MARANFAAALSAVLDHEGGYVDHPRDPGGATNLGVTIGTLSDWLGRKATKTEVRALTVEKVKPIYKARYWDVVRGDDLPAGLDFAVFDFAVNSGPARAAMYLQTILGVAPDGVIGPITLAAIAKHGTLMLINELCAHRLSFLERLSTWPTFGRGWTNRVNGVRILATQMAKEKPAQPPKPAPAPSAPPKAEKPASKPKSPAAVLIGGFIALCAAIYAFAKTNGVPLP